MFMCRGDLLVGLGATKRAAIEYECAGTLKNDDEELKVKRARLSAPAEDEKKKDDKVPVSVLTGFLEVGKRPCLITFSEQTMASVLP
jgi:hypothetical protein